MEGRKIALFAAGMADEKKGTEIVVYDVRGLVDITDYLVIVTAHSKSQIRAIVDSISRTLKLAGQSRMGQEGGDTGHWVLLDYNDCVIHIFSPALRQYYGLESLWGDAPKVDWQREAPAIVEQLSLVAP